jgi:putative mycofactocin binding protein MftB
MTSYGLPSDPTYLVPDWVRVRPEDFGLLFYDTRSTRLTFVRCGDLLEPPPFTGVRRILRVPGQQSAQAGSRATDAALSRLLADLVAKGLLVVATAD